MGENKVSKNVRSSVTNLDRKIYYHASAEEKLEIRSEKERHGKAKLTNAHSLSAPTTGASAGAKDEQLSLRRAMVSGTLTFMAANRTLICRFSKHVTNSLSEATFQKRGYFYSRLQKQESTLVGKAWGA